MSRSPTSPSPDPPVPFFPLLITLVVTGFLGICWYGASVQADVYRRAGIQISTWEVFIGTKPAERTIHVR